MTTQTNVTPINSKPARKAKRKASTSQRRAPRRAPDRRLANVTAAAIPTIGALLGWGATETLAAGELLGLLPLAMTLAVLSVSLPHVARGLTRVLHLDAREAWALAGAVDLSMVVSEAMLHFGAGAAHPGIWGAVMALGLIGSSLFNVRGFQR